MPVIKVKPWSEDQGEFVLIEEEDFNEEVHSLHGVDEVVADEVVADAPVPRQRRSRK